MDDPAIIESLLSGSPVAAAVLMAWYLHSKKTSDGLKALHARVDAFLSEQQELVRTLIDRLGRNK